MAFATNAGQSAPAQSTDDMIHGTLVVAGIERTYLVHLPRVYKKGHSLPLVLVFHGAGGSGASAAESTGLNKIADTRNFIVVYPDGLDHRWMGDIPKPGEPDTLNDILFVRALIAQLEKTYSIDPARIIATGFSLGAAFAQQLACRSGSPFFAVISVSGWITPTDAAACAPDRPVDITLFHGTADPVAPYEGGEVKLSDGRHFLKVSVADTLALWARINKCKTQRPTRSVPDGKDDGTHVELISYSGCESRGVVSHVRIVGGGHTWPGSSPANPDEALGRISHQISASEYIGIAAADVLPPD